MRIEHARTPVRRATSLWPTRSGSPRPLAERREMNIRHIRDLALKILGIFYLSHALIYARLSEWNPAGSGLPSFLPYAA